MYGLKAAIHPKAFLSRRRNVKRGLVARTRILQALEKQDSDIRGITGLSGLKYNVVGYHIRLLKAEQVVSRKGDKRPYVWGLTGAGQQRLVNSSVR